MKKILTLLLAVGACVTVQAQTSREEARRVILGGGGGSGNSGSNGSRDVILGGGNNGDSYPTYPGNYPSSSSRQAQIDQVNREYDNKIQSIRNNSYLSYEEKQRAIRQLEKDRQARIRQINNSYNGGRRRYEDGDRYEARKDNGKHKGWYKKDKNKNWKKGNRD
jgi:hypothetical protein